jgi:hypothetical protein
VLVLPAGLVVPALVVVPPPLVVVGATAAEVVGVEVDVVLAVVVGSSVSSFDVEEEVSSSDVADTPDVESSEVSAPLVSPEVESDVSSVLIPQAALDILGVTFEMCPCWPECATKYNAPSRSTKAVGPPP